MFSHVSVHPSIHPSICLSTGGRVPQLGPARSGGTQPGPAEGYPTSGTPPPVRPGWGYPCWGGIPSQEPPPSQNWLGGTLPQVTDGVLDTP